MLETGLRIIKLINRLGELSTTINSSVTNSSALSSSDELLIKKKYAERREILNKLSLELNTKDGTDFINWNDEWWRTKTEEILKLERVNIEKLNGFTVELGNKIKDMMNRKKLLIYNERVS
jgi:hypothetical protein